MKTRKLKKIIIINSLISLALIGSFIAIAIFIFNLNNISLNKISKINIQTRAINAKNEQGKRKLLDVDKYKEVWKNLPTKFKSTKTLKASEVKTIINTISKKYHIKDLQFAMKVPEELKSGKFNKKSIKIFLTTGTINFGAADDAKSLMFIKELFSTLPGNIIIEKLSLSKSREYSDNDYVTISKNGNIAKIRTRVKFHWYSKREARPKS